MQSKRDALNNKKAGATLARRTLQQQQGKNAQFYQRKNDMLEEIETPKEYFRCQLQLLSEKKNKVQAELTQLQPTEKIILTPQELAYMRATHLLASEKHQQKILNRRLYVKNIKETNA